MYNQIKIFNITEIVWDFFSVAKHENLYTTESLIKSIYLSLLKRINTSISLEIFCIVKIYHKTHKTVMVE